MINKKINSLDVAKFIMAILVICLHTYPLKKFEPLPLFSIITNIAVPFFFIASSYLLFKKFFNSNNNLVIIYDYIKRMIKLYLIWNVIYFPISIYGSFYNSTALTGGGIIKAIIIYIRDLFLRGEHYYSWPLWYLLSIIYVVIFVFCYYKFFKNKTKEYHILIISIIIFIIANYFTYIVDNIDKMNGVMYSFAKIIQLSLGSGRLLTGFLYFSIGMCIAKYQKKFNLINSFIMMIIMLILSYLFNLKIFNVLLYLFMFEFIMSIKLKDNNIYSKFRKSSTVIYFTHMIFFFIYTLIVGKDNCYGYLGFLITLFCSLILSYLVIKLDNKDNKLIKYIF